MNPPKGIPMETIQEAVTVVSSMKDVYANQWEHILNRFLPHLEIPPLSERYDSEPASAGPAMLSLSVLVEVMNWCARNAQSPITETTLARIQGKMDGCLYWCLHFLRVPALPDATPVPGDFAEGDMGTKCYLFPVYFLDSFRSFTHLYKDILKKQAALDMAIAFWTGLYDSEVPIYRDRRRNSDSLFDEEEKGILTFSAAVQTNPEGLSDAIMDGRICPPELFVSRTQQRLGSLLDVHQLPYLSSVVKSPTVEITNIVHVAMIIETLAGYNPALAALFLERGAPKMCMGTTKAMSERFSLLYARQMIKSTKPIGDQGEHAAMGKNALLSSAAAAALKVAAASPRSTLREVKKVFEAGAVELSVGIFGTILPWPKGLRGRVDEIWEGIERYGLYLEVLPVVVQGLSKRALPRQRKANVPVGRPDLLDVSKRIMALGSFAQLRVGLCDNLKHADRIPGTPHSSPKECSACRSVTYCSRECQREDWHEYHRAECAYLSQVSAEHKYFDRRYTHHNRAFHATIIRHAFETYAQQQDLKANAVSQSFGRNAVVYIDTPRPDNTETYSIDAYVAQTRPLVPPFLRSRFDAYVRGFKETNGTYAGRDTRLVKRQSARLVEGRFRYGDEDVNMLLFLNKTGSTIFKGTPPERRKQMEAFEARAPNAKSKFVVQGALVFYSKPRDFPDHRVKEPDAVSGWSYETVDLGREMKKILG